ncbi:MAG: aminopeptidase [Acholeplasmatales bacterium]|nr:aminopeptidase [Acholeplasmatales bacterium]
MYNENAWKKYDDKSLAELMKFNDGYKDFISYGKTERLCVKRAIEIAEKYGFKDIKSFNQLNPGDKVYVTNRGKNICAFVIGDEPMEKGINILGAHIDSPRLDIKQNPLYESNDFTLLDTHYYGGIVKYQWVARPLALHGVIYKKDGTEVIVNIGDNENDPVFVISDLLPHLAAEKNSKPGNKVIEGEGLDLTFSSIPLNEEDKKGAKEKVLKILKDTLNVEVDDFVSAEIEVVPAGKALDLGIDRSMVLGYGHDDRVCAYTSLMAVLDAGKAKYTTCAFLVDKEEIGSVGATGAQSAWFENILAELMNLTGDYSELKLRRCLSKSRMLSSDVSAGYDPLYKGVFEEKNAAYCGNGIVFNKYTGARGKSGCNDADPKFIAQIRNIMDNNNINYQTAELGKVDVGGGGTIAYILGNKDMYVVDAGVSILSMHAPCEIVSKVDVYEAYKAYIAFVKNAHEVE